METATRPIVDKLAGVVAAASKAVPKAAAAVGATGAKTQTSKPQSAAKKTPTPPSTHGEKIWIWSHRRTDQTIYTFRNGLDGYHDLKQLPFHGKKTKPEKLRKDYWSPMAMISFGTGRGKIGQSVFQKLRELKHLHEVAWEPEFRNKTPQEYTEEDEAAVKNAKEAGKTDFAPIRTKKERLVALTRQKANTVADMAAILAGGGKGNLIQKGLKGDRSGKLRPVVVQWANNVDRNYAVEWSGNVKHELLKDVSYEAEVLEPAGKEA